MTAATEKVCVDPAHAPTRVPEIAPGVPGVVCDEMDLQVEGLVPHALEAVTQMLPADTVLFNRKVIAVVPCPAVMV